MRCRALLAAAIALVSCRGREGTIGIVVIASPQSDLLSRIQRARITLSDPEITEEVERDANGALTLSLEMEAEGTTSDLLIEGFDDSGDRIAVGRSGPLPLAGIDAELSVFVAEPMSIAEAPAELSAPRADMGVAALTYGSVLLGGQANGQPVDVVDTYSLYSHQVNQAQPLPEPLSGPAVAAGTRGVLYLFGGLDADQSDSSVAYGFDITVAPSGRFFVIASDDGLARSGASAALAGPELVLVSGNPAVLIDGATAVARAVDGGENLAGVATTTVGESGLEVLITGAGVADTGAARYRASEVTDVDAPQAARRTEHRAVTLFDGRILIVGGMVDGQLARSAVTYEPLAAQFQVYDNVLPEGRASPAVALAGDYLILAGGHDGQGGAVPGVDVVSVTSLEYLETLPSAVPRLAATAAPLASGNILIAGGSDVDGEPLALIELFTPPWASD